MLYLTSSITLLLSFILVLSFLPKVTGRSTVPKLLVITFDSFGYNFLNKLPRSELPGFTEFIDKGVHVRWVENVFPSVTRPNHMTLVTGLYPESHGIVENYFYDPKLEASMPHGGKLRPEDSQWTDVGAEPVWVTNSKAGGGRRSGTIYWPCADARIKGRLPEESRMGEWSIKENEVSAIARVDLALDWLTGTGVQPVNFVAVYTPEPDDISHKRGPDSEQVLDSIRSRDKIVSHLLSEMKKRGLEDELNVIITADHGQLTMYKEATINIDELVDPSWYEAYPDFGDKAMSNIWPKKGYYQKLVDGLKGKHRNLHVATSSDSEELIKMHYSSSRRIAPIVIYAEPGWTIIGNKKKLYRKGCHGWDPRFCSHMWPFFMAKGPAFMQGLRDADPFHLTDVYPLMCHILGLSPAPNNGSLSKAAHILCDNRTANDSYAPCRVNSSSPSDAFNFTLPSEAYDYVLPSEKDNNISKYTLVDVGIGLLALVIAVALAVVAILCYVRHRNNVSSSASYRRTFSTEGPIIDDLGEDEAAFLSNDAELM